MCEPPFPPQMAQMDGRAQKSWSARSQTTQTIFSYMSVARYPTVAVRTTTQAPAITPSFRSILKTPKPCLSETSDKLRPRRSNPSTRAALGSMPVPPLLVPKLSRLHSSMAQHRDPGLDRKTSSLQPSPDLRESRGPAGVEMQILNAFIPCAPLAPYLPALSPPITPALSATEFHGARLLFTCATRLHACRWRLLAAVRSALLTDLGSMCHYRQEPPATCTLARATRPQRWMAGSVLQEAIIDPIRLHSTEEPECALKVQPRDGHARARAREWRPPLASPSLPRLGAWCWCSSRPD
jgi:hypothetical protein